MKRTVVIPIVVMCVVALVVSGCAGRAAANAPADAATSARTVPVQVAPVESGEISQVLSFTGNLQAKDSVRVVPMVSGRVASIAVAVGDRVKAGDPLAQIEKDVYTAQAQQAEAALQAAQYRLTRMQQGSRAEEIAAAEAGVRAARTAMNAVKTPTDDQRTIAAANMDKAEAALKLAQSEYDKIAWAGQAGQTAQALTLEQATVNYQSAAAAYNLTVKPTDGTLAPLENNLAQAELKLALVKQPYIETDFAQARAAVAQAKAAYDLAQTQLGYTTIRAPFDGTVAELYISVGSATGPSSPVALFVSSDSEAVINVDESHLGQIQLGQQAAIRSTAFADHDFPALVTTVAPVADSRTHSVAVRVTPKDDEGKLRSGMFVTVSILTQSRPSALLVPQSAIVDGTDQKSIFVVKGDTVEQRTVTTGLKDGTRIEVVAGIQAGEQVVTAGQDGLTTGARVEISKGS